MVAISGIWVLLTLILCTAYSTLVERYMMATVQRRVGPDYLFFGIAQPLIDGLKLLMKDYISVYRIWDTTYFMFVVLLLTLALVGWVLFVFDPWTYILTIDYSVLFLLLTAAIGIYTVILSGLSGCCRYGILGTFRFVFQLVSYEINFSLVVLVVFGYAIGFNCTNVLSVSFGHVPLFCYSWLLVYMLLMGMLETARVPFDLPESESELVSGYNTEYGSFLFALLFLGEYCSIIVFAGFMVMTLGGSLSALVKLSLVSVFTTLIISSRCLYARLRYYDVVILGWMHMLWFGLLLLSLYILLVLV